LIHIHFGVYNKPATTTLAHQSRKLARERESFGAQKARAESRFQQQAVRDLDAGLSNVPQSSSLDFQNVESKPNKRDATKSSNVGDVESWKQQPLVQILYINTKVRSVHRADTV